VTNATDTSISGTQPRSGRAWLVVALFTLVCFAVVASQLRRLEFSNGGENAVVASVQELRRGDGTWKSWLTPTLHEELRTKKPPLATWLSALSTRPATVEKFTDRDPAVRAQAFETFAWQVRLPSLLAGCGVLVATYVLGTLVADRRLGLISLIVCGSSLFWLRNVRLATTDVHLALWVAVTNCFLAAAVLNRRWWPGFIGAGVALGLAMMSKGPVALVQTVVPVIAFVAWRRWRVPGMRLASELEVESPRRQRVLPALLVGLALFIVVGFCWYGFVVWQRPEVLAEWRSEVTREGATDMEPSRWYNYILLIVHVVPWSFFLVAGLIGAGVLFAKKPLPGESLATRRIVFALMLLLVPVLVMSFFRDREIRYLIPLLSSASVVAGWAVMELLVRPDGPPGRTWLVALFHWLPLLAVTAGLLVMASPIGVIKTKEGGPWYTLAQGITGAAVIALLIGGSMLAQRRWRLWALPIGTAVVMLSWNIVMNEGYRFYREGRSEMRPLAEQILAWHPSAKVYSFRADRPIRRAPIDLAIYLNHTVQNVANPGELAGTTGPRIYMVRERVKDPSAVDAMAFAPPAGGPWRPFAQVKTNSAAWFVYAADGTE
jgi:4-amino-4-deoxy-L-arabinose transferase-like glycosyltransferase